MQTLLRTPLYERHVALGARMVPFAGWEMPVQYEGVIPEHRAVRTDCGVFDVSHMGEIDVEGPTRRASCCRRCSRTTSTKIGVGQAQYTLLTNERGGIVDDLIVYRLEPAGSCWSSTRRTARPTSRWLKEREIARLGGARRLRRVRAARRPGAARARAARARRGAGVHASRWARSTASR